MPKEGKMTKNLCPDVIKIKEDVKQCAGWGCKNGDGVSYPWPCSVGDSQGCKRKETK